MNGLRSLSDRCRDAFATRNVAYLKGDWTRADPAISRFLRRMAATACRFMSLSPAWEKPVVLPQILTQTACSTSSIEWEADMGRRCERSDLALMVAALGFAATAGALPANP